MTDTPFPQTANPTPETCPPEPETANSGTWVAAETKTPPARVLYGPGEWICNALEPDAIIRYLANPTRHRPGLVCEVGPVQGTSTISAAALTEAGFVGIWTVAPSPPEPA